MVIGKAESDAVEQYASEKIPVNMDEAAATANPEASATALALAAGVVVGAAAAGSGSADLDAAELSAPRDSSVLSQLSVSDLIDHRESVIA